MQYYISYVLGWPQDSNKKADMGTIVHKVMECLADAKKLLDCGDNHIEDDILGKIPITREDLITPSVLTEEEVDKINKTRSAKSIYKNDCYIKYNHTRLGRDLVQDWFDRIYKHYTTKFSHHRWMPADRKHCLNWVWMALEYKKGLFDPRKRNIVDTEVHFDITLERDWAVFAYELPNGEKISGNLAIKGTIDLIVGEEDGIIEVVDYKTGQRRDWTSNSSNPKHYVKTYEKLKNDPQLMLYYYAVKHLYPNAKTIILTIYFIRDGGPFSLCFDTEHIAKMEDILRETFNKIRDEQNPELLDYNQKHFKCKTLCHYCKNKFNDDDEDNMCMTIHKEIKLKGMEQVDREYTYASHEIGKYEAPG